MTSRIRVGTRGSRLALLQSQEVARRLREAHNLDSEIVETVVISTTGDRVQDRPLYEIGGKGMFTKEIEDALLEGRIDLAVHSMKDLPAQMPQGLTVGCVLPREDARDAFVSPIARSISELPSGARIGTSSVRRGAQIHRLRRDISVVDFRGNVETRLRKLENGAADATILACAGLNRLGLQNAITSIVAMEEMLPALAQGAIGIETRNGDARLNEMLAAINDLPTWIAIVCERSFLGVLEGSCRMPIAGHAQIKGNRLLFKGEVYTPDGKMIFAAERQGDLADAAMMGEEAGAEVRRAALPHLVM